MGRVMRAQLTPVTEACCTVQPLMLTGAFVRLCSSTKSCEYSDSGRVPLAANPPPTYNWLMTTSPAAIA